MLYDIFIDHLRGAAELKPARHRPHYSVITRAELFAGSTAANLSSQLLAPFREIPDALIAATALEHQLVLATRNLKHFESVSGLRIRSF